MDDISQRPLFSEESGTLGFDLSSGNVWIYPENYPIREYQFNIVKNALYRNTLVCLPTGLGKTFIAAVVMYNFWRWYPKGKVIFLAPTKPLVAQQIHACHEIMGIPSEETIELTGATNQKHREIAWTHKRVIFATPQTFHKDLEKNIFPINLVKCIVIDEAHKALGKHSYCESIRLLSAQNNYFRVLALSATPGDKISKVHEVISNLHISNLELRDDMSADIAPYINERKMDIILVRLSDKLARFKERYVAVMDPHVRILVRLQVLRGDTGNISKGRIFLLTREFQSRPNKSGNYGQIMKTLNILLTMYHAYELMIRHGLRAFLHFYENHSDKFWMKHEINLHDLLEDIKNYLGPFPVIEPLPDGSVPDVPNDLIFGHNKFYKLKEVLERHFKSFRDKNQDTRAIVFVEYRDIVNEVHVLLLQSRPLIRPQMFVGQAGQKQKQQVRALENFRSNKVNVLISTSVGEEGLDVGEVDLIVCFDISQSSPIRLVQRMGRTGRQRDGHIIALVTDGKEHQSLKATMSRKDSLNSKVLQSSDIVSALYEDSPRMVPNGLKPECRKMHIKVQPKTPQVKGARKKKEIERRKKQNTALKTVEREAVAKSEGQSSMDRFFKAKKSEEKNLDLDPLFVSQTQQAIKPENVKLLLSDQENVDFLTLFAMRNSRTSFHILDTEIDTTYVASYPPKGLEVLVNFTLPDLSILDCVASLQKIEITSQKMKNQSISISPNHEEVFDSNCFEKENEFPDRNSEIGEVSIARSFADLIYDSSSSDEVEFLEDAIMKSNKFETSGKFDDLLNDTTDESEIEEIGASPNQDLGKEVSSHAKNLAAEEKDEEFNFSKLLEDSSFESDTVQDTCKSVILENKETTVNAENPSKQQNVSRDTSFTSLKSNCSGITITQAIEEVGRINANKLVSNSSLVNKQDSDDIQIIKDIPVSLKIKPSTSEIQKAESQKKYLRFQISDSDDDLFDIDIDEVPIRNKKMIVNSNDPLASNALRKPVQGEVLPIQDYQIMRVDSNKSVSVAEKENSNLALNAFNDYDWESDFEVPTSEVDSQRYFKKDGNPKTENKIESFETSWISCGKENSVPAKKFSLFSGDKPSTARNDTSDKISSFNNLNKSSAKEENNDDNDFDAFKKPATRAPGIFSLKRTKINAPSTSNDKLNGFSAPVNEESTSNSKVEKRKEQNEISFNASSTKNLQTRRKERKNNRYNCEFLDNEADVSIDGGNISEGTSGEDEDLEDFVSYTQDVHEDTDMRAHYLHSVKSPVKRPGAFLIKKPTLIEENVYSQPNSQLNDTYLYDSFCVQGDEIEHDEETDDDLEITYLHLSEESRRESKRKRGNSPVFQIKRRKRKKGRIQNLNNDSSSEDEIENMRRQIEEKSFLLKNNKS